MKTDSVPDWLNPAAVGILILTVFGILVMLILTLGGLADPKPLGTLSVDIQFVDDSVELWESPAGTLTDQRYQLTSQRSDQPIFDEFPSVIYCPCSLEVTAIQISGERDSSYGLWWRTSLDTPIQIAALNGNNYFAVLQDSSDPIQNWQTFPWLLPQGEANQLRIDLAGNGKVIVRINDEVAAEFTDSPIQTIAMGLYVQASPRGGTATGFERLRIWQQEP